MYIIIIEQEIVSRIADTHKLSKIVWSIRENGDYILVTFFIHLPNSTTEIGDIRNYPVIKERA